MRRMLLSAAGLALLVVVAGCNHTAGVCDCDMTPGVDCPCWAANAPHTVGVPHTGAAILKPEPIKELPKGTPDK